MNKDNKHVESFGKFNENLNISDVNDSYFVFYLNSDNQWVQSRKEVFKSMNDAINYIGDKKRLKVFKMVQ